MTLGGGGALPDVGDFIGSYRGAGLDQPYEFFVEVPAGQTLLQLDLFDADVLAGSAVSERSGELDQDRTGAVATHVRYQIFAPDGTLVPSRFSFGDALDPVAAHDAWKLFFDSSTALISGGSTYRDTFSANSYANDNGSALFAGPWIETNDIGPGVAGSPTQGDVQVTGGALVLTNASNTTSPYSNQPSVEREVDLSAAAAAVVTFDWSTGAGVDRMATPGTGAFGVGDSVTFEVSSDGGVTWSQMDFFGADPMAIPAEATYDITDFLAANTRVRFRISNRFAGANESFSVDNFQIRSVPVANGAAPTAGHWRLRVDMGGTVNGNPVPAPADAQDDVNALGIRAHDGTPGAGGQEFNVYADSFAIAGINDNDGARDYTWYPYITSGCSLTTHDFDWDANQAAPAPPNPNLPPYGLLRLTSRDGGFINTNATMSDNNVWRDEVVSGFTSDPSATSYGIWLNDVRTEDWTQNNYGPVYFSRFDGAASPPTTQPEANTFRIYFPTDAGAAPPKPFLGQFVTFVTNSSGSNPPTVGQTSRYAVTVTLDNPTGSIGPITFSAPSRVVTSNVPGGEVVYGGLAFVTQGSIVSQPAVGASGDVVWNPGTLAAGATQARLTYFVDVTPLASPYSLDLTATPGSGSGTRATWLDETQNSATPRAEYTFGELCQLRLTSTAPIPAVVASLDGFHHAEGLELRLVTAAEANSTSFEVFRVTPDGRDAVAVGDRVTATLDAPQGGVYRWIDRDASSNGTYLVVERTARGAETVYGPFSVNASASDDAIDLPRRAARATPAALDARLEALRGDSAHHAATKASRAIASGGSAIQPMAIEVVESALHRVSLADLTAAGGSSANALQLALDAGQLRLRTSGQDVAWRRAAGGTALEFWGEASDSPFDSARTYVLDEGPGLRMAVHSGPPVQVEPVPQSVRETLVIEEDLRPVTLLPLDPAGDFWFWDFLRPGADALRTFSIDVPAPSAGKRSARLQVHLQGAAPGVHRLDVRWNGVWLGTASVADLEAGITSFALASDAVLEGPNLLELESIDGDLVFVDHFELAYDRFTEPHDGAVLHQGDGLEMVAGPFTKPWIWAYDLAEPRNPILRTDVQVIQRPEGYYATWRRTAGTGPFLVHEAAGRRAPAALRPFGSASSLDPPNGAEHLIVAASSLVGAAAEIAAHRTAQGTPSLVIDLQDIYDGLSDGLRDPRALQAFFEHATTTWSTPPQSILLVGAGTYDYRDVLGLGGTLLPPLLVQGAESLYATDQAFVDFDADGLGDLPIGRLPALLPAEVSAYAAKLAAYEATPATSTNLAEAWQQAVVLAADNADEAGDFGQDAAHLGALLPVGYEQTTIGLGTEPLATARAALDSAWADGFGWLTYIGHGGIDRLAAEGLLTAGDVAALPTDSTPVVFAASCHVALHAVPGFDALGETLTTAAERGAVAVIAPSWLTEHPASALLADRLLRRVFQDGANSSGSAGAWPTLGDRLKQAIDDAASAGISLLDLGRYQILGDPALRLPLAPAADDGGTCAPDCGGAG